VRSAMSALGQKQTYAMQKGMSALPPKADIKSIRLRTRRPQNCYTCGGRQRIHVSIRRQPKEGAMDPSGIAFAALKDVLLPKTH
jgi:hypothetical protein